MQQECKSTSFPPFRPLQSIKWSVPKPNMGNSHQSLLTQMTGVPRAFQKLQRTKKKGEHCLRTHCLSHLKAQLGKNVVLHLLGCKLRLFFLFSLHPPFRMTNFLWSANKRRKQLLIFWASSCTIGTNFQLLSTRTRGSFAI